MSRDNLSIYFALTIHLEHIICLFYILLIRNTSGRDFCPLLMILLESIIKLLELLHCLPHTFKLAFTFSIAHQTTNAKLQGLPFSSAFCIVWILYMLLLYEIRIYSLTSVRFSIMNSCFSGGYHITSTLTSYLLLHWPIHMQSGIRFHLCPKVSVDSVNDCVTTLRSSCPAWSTLESKYSE